MTEVVLLADGRPVMLSPRVRTMIGLLIAHQVEVDGIGQGTAELHCADRRVKLVIRAQLGSAVAPVVESRNGVLG